MMQLSCSANHKWERYHCSVRDMLKNHGIQSFQANNLRDKQVVNGLQDVVPRSWLCKHQ